MWLVGLKRLTNSQHHSEPDVLHKMITTVNPLYMIDAQIASCTFSLWCHFRQCPWDIDSVPAERAGEKEVGKFEHWLPLGFAVESPWSALCGPFLFSFAQIG